MQRLLSQGATHGPIPTCASDRGAAILVVDCSDLAGAFCGRVLTGLGAQVVRCGGRDAWQDTDVNAQAFYRRGVEWRSSAVTTAAVPPDLLTAADVILTTGRPSDLAAAGLDFDHLSTHRRDLVVVNVSPFGLSGPRAEWLGGNLVATAVGGMLYVNGWPDEAPLQPLGLQAYHVAGIHGAIGALLALRVRDASGHGQLVDISLQESVIAAVEHVGSLYRENGTVAQRRGTLHWTRAFRTVPTRDGDVLATHLGDWDALRAWIAAELPGSAVAEERWHDPEYRRDHCDELFEEIAAWASIYQSRDLVNQAQQRRLAFAPVADLREAAQHPQLQARGFFTVATIENTVRRVPTQPLPIPSSRFPAPGSQLPPPNPHSPLPTPQPLQAFRVLDLTWVVAGPVATRVLADHGAEVIKIEHPETATPGSRRGGLFGNLNRGKQSVVLDLGTASGLAQLRQLIATSDVLVENFSPRVLANWHLDDRTLHAINPRLTIVHMSGFGRDGPLCDWVSYGPTLQAQLGFSAHMRHPGGHAAGWGYSYSDMVSGYVAALAAIAALREGGGRVVDLSQLEVLASVIGPALIAAANGEPIAPAVGNGSQEGTIAPHGVYRCRDTATAPVDRWCAIAVTSDRQWAALVEATGLQAIAQPELATAAARQRRAVEIDRLLEQWTRGRVAESIVETLQAAGVPCGVVADARDLLADDHLRARGMWVRVPTPEGDLVELEATPIRLSLTPGKIRAPGPDLNDRGEGRGARGQGR